MCSDLSPAALLQRIENCLGQVGNGQNGVGVVAGALDNYVIVGNDTRGNNASGVADRGRGVNKQLSGNLPVSSNSVQGLGGRTFTNLPSSDDGTMIL